MDNKDTLEKLFEGFDLDVYYREHKTLDRLILASHKDEKFFNMIEVNP